MRVSLVLLFACLLGFFFITNDLNFFKFQDLEALGEVTRARGTVLGKAENEEFFTSLEAQAPLASGHKVVTGFNSVAEIQFGESFLLTANSSVRLAQLPSGYQVHLLYGELERADPGKKVRFLVENQKVEGKRIKNENPIKMTSVDNVDMKVEKLTPLSNRDKKLQKLLRDTFKLHQRFIEKCFIKHYERQKGRTQSGEILVRFQIDKSGRLDKPTIRASAFDDEAFHDCLKEVVSRVRLKFYDDEPKTVDFPIQVTLPR